MKINQDRFFNLGRMPDLNEEDFFLTSREAEILKDQIDKNKKRIAEFVALIDRLVNIESYPASHPKVEYFRKRMELLMDENNTFRQNLWLYWLTNDKVSFSL